MLIGRARDGFMALAAVIALVFIMVLGAFAILPIASATHDQRNTLTAAAYLQKLTDDPEGWVIGFMDAVGKLPGQLTHLSLPITSDDLDLCDKKYAGAAGGWAPNADRIYLATGIPLAIGTIQNDLVLLTDPGNVQYLTVEIDGVTEAEAVRLDAYLDSTTGGSTGRLRWVTFDVTQGLVTVRWLLQLPPAGFPNSMKC